MLRVLSRAQMREFDRLAIERCQIPSQVLMENAGRGAAEVIARQFGLTARARPPLLALVCGSGNNGGDGYVAARRLQVLGAAVEVVALAPEEHLRGDALASYRAFKGIGGRVHSVSEQGALAYQVLSRADGVVDALFGTGLDRAVEGPSREAIDRINAAPGRRVAIDLPSGLDADTGSIHGAAVRAELTVTLAAHKLGLLTPSGLAHSGRVELIDIGLPQAALSEVGESAFLVEASDVSSARSRRSPDAHKGRSGRVLVLAGSPGKVGAALLVAHGALRAGAGLVTLAGAPEFADALDRRVLEAMTARVDFEALEAELQPLLDRTDVVAIGPGFGLDARARRVVEHVLQFFSGTVVVDADAISHFVGRPEALARASGRVVLTPHSGELGRLLGTTALAVESDRFSALRRAVEATQATVLLKGPHTLIAGQGLLPVVSPAGSSVLATGGAGDVLTGVIAALACESDPFTAAFSGAFLHARAGELWARHFATDRGLLAHEIADWLAAARADLSGGDVALPL